MTVHGEKSVQTSVISMNKEIGTSPTQSIEHNWWVSSLEMIQGYCLCMSALAWYSVGRKIWLIRRSCVWFLFPVILEIVTYWTYLTGIRKWFKKKMIQTEFLSLYVSFSLETLPEGNTTNQNQLVSFSFVKSCWVIITGNDSRILSLYNVSLTWKFCWKEIWMSGRTCIWYEWSQETVCALLYWELLSIEHT